MKQRIFDIIDVLARPQHNRFWYQESGLSLQESYDQQKAEIKKQLLVDELKRLLREEEAERAAEIANIQFNIKTEVK